MIKLEEIKMHRWKGLPRYKITVGGNLVGMAEHIGSKYCMRVSAPCSELSEIVRPKELKEIAEKLELF